MGSWASGRYRTRNRGTVERSLRFDMRILRRDGFVRPGVRTSGTSQWSRRGDPIGSIGFTIDLTDPDPNRGFAVLNFSVDGEPRTQRISIQADACRYGGRRYYFICPKWNERCEVLCGVGGVFASRGFHRLTYYSQSETPLDRLKRAEQKAEARLFGKDGNPRPRGANRERLGERWCDLSEQWERLFAVEVGRRFGIGL